MYTNPREKHTVVTTNTVSAAEAKIFAKAMEGRNVDLTISISEVGTERVPRTATEIVLEQGKSGRRFRFYAEASPVCYAKDSSKVMPLSRHGFTLSSAAVGEDGVRLVLEDRKTGAQRALRILLSRRDDCSRIVSYECVHPVRKLRAAA
jgi:hypothetical protein